MIDEGFQFPREHRVHLSDKGCRKVRALVKERDGYRCVLCGSIFRLECHHIRFRSAYGSDTVDNMILLCNSCHHIYAHGKKEDSYRSMFLDYINSPKCKAFDAAHAREIERIYKRYGGRNG